MQRQPLAIKFLGERPADVETDIEFSGSKQIHGQLRYGSTDSIRVGLIVDQLSDSTDDFDLYVDLNRDRKLEADEKVSGTGRTREFELEAEINKAGVPQRHARRVTFRRSVDPAVFSITTHGGYASQWKAGSENVSVWRLDGDGNGLFSDNKDEIWIDANADGHWNPISERFSFRPAVILNGQRFAVRGDEIGTQVDFQPIVGEGTLAFDLDLASEAKLEFIRMSVIADDGSCYSFESIESVELPVGSYTLGQFSVVLKPLEGPNWSFSFSHSGIASQQVWYEIEKDDEVSIPLFGELKVGFTSPISVAIGKELSVRPNLFTSDGLYITTSGKGNQDLFGEFPANHGKFIINLDDENIGETSSGFA